MGVVAADVVAVVAGAGVVAVAFAGVVDDADVDVDVTWTCESNPTLAETLLSNMD